jgi:hypothetical protein
MLTIARALFAINTEIHRQRLYYQTDETHYRHHLMYYAISLILSNTVKLSYNKLGYNELGYNKLPVITNRFFHFFQSQIHVYYIIQLGYNEFRL